MAEQGERRKLEPIQILENVSERLDAHFRRLRSDRELHAAGNPLFVLEHGLDDSEVQTLRENVRAAISEGPPSRSWALSFLVYAAEVGYRYEGKEYWETFEAATPGWTRYGERGWMRERFREFASAYGGARPSGAWAGHRSIISWPITHAVLPTDLQLHLVRLLYEYRRYLTASLLTDPVELGSKLATQASRTSARFRNFCRSTALLGQVAAALLSWEEDESPLLLPSTLRRITADLSIEREARRWLADARTSASRVQVRGMTQGAGGSGLGLHGTRNTDGRVAPPTLTLTRTEAGWRLRMEAPDFAPLMERFPDLREALDSLRCSVAAVRNQPPLPRGALLYVGRRIDLDTWPGFGVSLLRLEKGDEKLNLLLAEECRFPSGPLSIFRLVDADAATEVRTKVLRPGREYVALSEREIDELPDWATQTPIECTGAFAYELRVPSTMSAADVDALSKINLGVATNIEIRPVGFEPASWDGEGTGEWISGDAPILAISSDLAVRHCGVVIDDAAPQTINWPQGDACVYIRLTQLAVGSHLVRVILVPDDARDIPAITGELRVVIREPRLRTSTGTYREAVLLLASPAGLTLEDMWEGRGNLEILGPPTVPVKIALTLERGMNRLARREFSLRLPISSSVWRKEFERQYRQIKDIYRCYDDASGCIVEISHPEVGSASLRCERAFVPLRWGTGKDGDEPFLRLHDNVGDQPVQVNHYNFAFPDKGQAVDPLPDGSYRATPGGLFVASTTEYAAGAVLAPRVRDLTDLRRTGIEPRLKERSKSLQSLLDLLVGAGTWTDAQVPGNPIASASRQRVLRAFAKAVAGLVGGRWWSGVERDTHERELVDTSRLDSALARPGHHLAFREELKRLANDFSTLSLRERVYYFAELNRAVVRSSELENASESFARREPFKETLISPLDRDWLAELSLRVASSPGRALAWAGEDASRALTILIENPIILRAARYLVLSMEYSSEEVDLSWPYRGWQWE